MNESNDNGNHKINHEEEYEEDDYFEKKHTQAKSKFETMNANDIDDESISAKDSAQSNSPQIFKIKRSYI